MKPWRLLTNGVIRQQTVTAPMSRDESRALAEWYQTLFALNGSQYLVGQFANGNADYLLGACGPVYAVLDRRA